MMEVEPVSRRIAELRDALPVTTRCVYLQTGTKGPINERTFKALCDAEWLAASEGPAAPDGKSPLIAQAEEARNALAGLFNVDARELCWSFNTSIAMRTVLRSLAPCKSDELITSDLEHVATRSLCNGLVDACGLAVSEIATAGSEDDFLQRLEDALRASRANRKIMILSQVSCQDGRRLPVAAAVALARRFGAVSLIDGAQAVGQMPVDLSQIDADFYVASGHKWLLGPTGVGYIHVRSSQLEAFNPNWLADADRADADAAQLGEMGSINWAQRAALGVAIKQISHIGLDAIEARVAGLTTLLRGELAELPGIQLLGPGDPGRGSGMVSFAIEGRDADDCSALVDALYRNDRIAIKFQPEQTALRVSLAVFNTADEVHRLLAALKTALR